MSAGEEIGYSRHALAQLRERNIREEELIDAIRFPDNLRRQTDGRIQTVKRLKRNGKQYLLIVVYRHVPSGIRVITAFITSKVYKYLE